MARHPILHPWQQVRTNVQIPKRTRSGPLRSREDNHAPRNPALKNAPRTHPFSNGIPRHKWWVGFKKMHPDISLRCADGLEMRRALCLDRDSAIYFYNLLEQVYNAHQYHPNHITVCTEGLFKLLKSPCVFLDSICDSFHKSKLLI